jgi:hypothetical protein
MLWGGGVVLRTAGSGGSGLREPEEEAVMNLGFPSPVLGFLLSPVINSSSGVLDTTRLSVFFSHKIYLAEILCSHLVSFLAQIPCPSLGSFPIWIFRSEFSCADPMLILFVHGVFSIQIPFSIVVKVLVWILLHTPDVDFSMQGLFLIPCLLLPPTHITLH